MFQALDDDDKKKPRLQLEYSGAGPGNKGRTALGYSEGDGFPSIDATQLPEPPWWFGLVKACRNLDYSRVLRGCPLLIALHVLERAGVPPIYRLGLGFQWNFIDEERDDFSLLEFVEILYDLNLMKEPIDEVLKRMENRATFRIWRTLGPEISGFNLDDFKPRSTGF
ncbi:MAG TPA: hypothetical protein V6C81_23835 [Planktothrix sp.]|jgi:hypothetical protein